MLKKLVLAIGTLVVTTSAFAKDAITVPFIPPAAGKPAIAAPGAAVSNTARTMPTPVAGNPTFTPPGQAVVTPAPAMGKPAIAVPVATPAAGKAPIAVPVPQFGTPTDNRNGASKPEDSRGQTVSGIAQGMPTPVAGNPTFTPPGQAVPNGGDAPRPAAGKAPITVPVIAPAPGKAPIAVPVPQFGTPTDNRNGAAKPED
jgi:hypothetical protein